MTHAPRAAIFGCAGPALGSEEAAFFREADPWGFILFARNVETPEQLTALTADLRESVGRDVPILIDQEGGRVARMTGPRWCVWRPVLETFEGRDEVTARALLRLRYRIIGAELRAVGIDVNCVPLLDVLMAETHEIIGPRALGSRADLVAERASAVRTGCAEAGVLPVIKHIPGHGRASVDSHLALPRTSASRATLEATDFAPFRAHNDAVLGMTAHVVFEALDPDRPATLSKIVVDAIRRDIGFDGLLMTDDLSMRALSGDMAMRTVGALEAGCDVILHCNGDRAEMEAIAGVTPALAGTAADRADRALAARIGPAVDRLAEDMDAYETLSGESLR